VEDGKMAAGPLSHLPVILNGASTVEGSQPTEGQREASSTSSASEILGDADAALLRLVLLAR